MEYRVVDNALGKYAVEGAPVILNGTLKGDGKNEASGYGLALRHSKKPDSCWILTCDHVLHPYKELRLGTALAVPIWRGTNHGESGVDAALLYCKDAPSALPWSRGILLDLKPTFEHQLEVVSTIHYESGCVDKLHATLPLTGRVKVAGPCRCKECKNEPVTFSYEALQLLEPQDVGHGLSGLPFSFPLVHTGREWSSERNAWVGNLARAVSETPDIARYAFLLPLRAFSSALQEYAGVAVLDVQVMLARVMAMIVKKRASHDLESRVSDNAFLDIEPQCVTQADRGAGGDSDDCNSMLVEAEGGAGKTVWLYRRAQELADRVLSDSDNRTVLCVGSISEFLRCNRLSASLLDTQINYMKQHCAISDDLSGLLFALGREVDNGHWEDARLLLDGLDQVVGSDAPALHDALCDVLERYPRTSVTSRSATAVEYQTLFASRYKLPRPSHRQVREYLGVTAYERLRSGRGIAADLLRLPLYIQPLRKLGRDEQISAPQTRAHYFDHFWHAYLTQENRARDARGLQHVECLDNFGEVNRKLLDLALRMTLDGKIQFVDRDWSEWEETALKVAEWWRSKGEPSYFLEIEPPPEDFGEARFLGFIHQAWQEYLAARKLAAIRPDKEDFARALDKMAACDSGGQEYDLWSSVARFLAGALELEGREPSRGLDLLRSLCCRGAFRIGFLVAEEWRRRGLGGNSKWDWDTLPDQIHHLRWLCWQMVRYRPDADPIYPDDLDERYVGAPRCALRALAQLDNKSRSAFRRGVQSYCKRLGERWKARPVELVGLLELLAGAESGQATSGAALLGESDLLEKTHEWMKFFIFSDPRRQVPQSDVQTEEDAYHLGYQPSATSLLEWLYHRLDKDPPAVEKRQSVEEAIKGMDRSDAPWDSPEASTSELASWLGITFVRAVAAGIPPPC